MNKWMVHKATRPKIGNSATARMRPYDFRLQELIPELKENEFYLPGSVAIAHHLIKYWAFETSF